jgi:hypothetical protein
MKYWIWGMALGICCAGAWAGDAYREFTDTQGRSIRGRVLSFDAAKGVVQIEAENGKKAKIPLTGLIGEDQEYILEWEATKFFHDSSALNITCNKRRVDQRKEKEWDEVRYTSGGVEKELMKETVYESLLYEIEFYSRSKADLADLRLEYIIFYEQSEMSWATPEVVQKTKRAKISIPLIKGRSKTNVKTESVEIHRDNIAQKNWVSGRIRTGGEGDVHGFRARLYMTLPSGQELMREFSYPDQLSEEKFPWKG